MAYRRLQAPILQNKCILSSVRSMDVCVCQKEKFTSWIMFDPIFLNFDLFSFYSKFRQIRSNTIWSGSTLISRRARTSPAMLTLVTPCELVKQLKNKLLLSELQSSNICLQTMMSCKSPPYAMFWTQTFIDISIYEYFMLLALTQHKNLGKFSYIVVILKGIPLNFWSRPVINYKS